MSVLGPCFNAYIAIHTPAGLVNALKLVGKQFSDIRVVVNGVGAAGTATTKLLLVSGVKNIIGCDRNGILYEGRREHTNPWKDWYAAHTNPEKRKGTVSDALKGADVFIGLSGPGAVTKNDIKKMEKDPIVFLLANPTPEIMPEEIRDIARIIATGRSDYPNQINNALVFPGLFRGTLDCRAKEINDEMKLARRRQPGPARPRPGRDERGAPNQRSTAQGKTASLLIIFIQNKIPGLYARGFLLCIVFKNSLQFLKGGYTSQPAPRAKARRVLSHSRKRHTQNLQ